MPYVECPSCRISLYSAANHSWIEDVCPVCGASLMTAPKRFPSDIGAWTLCREFPSSPLAVESARHALDGLYGELGEDVHAEAVLLVSELVTNSVMHSKATGGTIELLACVTPSLLHVEVSDDGDGFEPRPPGSDDDEPRHGLRIVDRLADRWGRPTRPRTSVWFEIDRPIADRAAAGQAG
jgi:anti-sigma regulatory factor (Ser/Thr protein kinase)